MPWAGRNRRPPFRRRHRRTAIAIVPEASAAKCSRRDDVIDNYPPPVVQIADVGHELTMARWGMLSSSQALCEATKMRATKLEAKGKQVNFKELLKKEPDNGTTNIRNLARPHWKQWLGIEHRCIVPMFPLLANSTRKPVETSGSLSTRVGR